MKKIFDTKIIENKELAKDIYKLIVDCELDAKAGQFVELKLPSNEFTLRRPFGIASTKNNQLKMFYRVIGKGTKYLSECKVDDELNLIAPLGNGFDYKSSEKILLIGGGMGVAPLMMVAEQSNADIIIGGRTAEEVIFFEEEFKSCADKIYVTTDDGSYGSKGFVTDILTDKLKSTAYKKVLVCGPEIMMKNVFKIVKGFNIECQVSLEKRMGCGLGACLSCSVDTVNGRRKVCKDGPVFKAEDVFLIEE